jgi:hypothetical protein
MIRPPAILRGLLLLFAAACSNHVVTYQVNVVDSSCGNQPSPLAGAGFLKFTITGDGLGSPLVDYYPVAQKNAAIPQIPAGTNRVIEVRAYDNDPRVTTANLISLGRSAPFTVPTALPSPPTGSVTVFLRPVGVFMQANVAGVTGTCSQMTLPRAGHSATLLSDGRVFVAGGFQLDAGNALSDTEFYDPTTGSFDAGPPIAIGNNALPRAYHAATLSANGQVVLVGGEEYRSSGGTTSTIPVEAALVFDPIYHLDYGGVQLYEARSHAGIGVDDAGRILIVGGNAIGGQPADMVEWLDPATWAISLHSQAVSGDCDGGILLDPDAGTAGGCALSFPRLGAAVATVAAQGGQYVAVAGGTDGVSLADAVTFFQYQGSSFGPLQQTLPLQNGRVQAGIATLQDANHLILAGGSVVLADGGQTLLGDTNIVDVATFNAAEGPSITARSNICTALLLDNRVLTIGGLSANAVGVPQSDPSVELIAADGGSATAIPQAGLYPQRYAHTCTTLNDGSVLVLGGMQLAPTGQQTVLQDAWIYMPAPLD